LEVVRVQWLNERHDIGRGHDIAVIERGHHTYIEVKSTILLDNDWFKLSRAQRHFAARHKNDFVLYCIYGAGLPSATITEIRDPYQCWQRDEIDGHPIEIDYSAFASRLTRACEGLPSATATCWSQRTVADKWFARDDV
jgi:uncharacterized protein DUF3883